MGEFYFHGEACSKNNSLLEWVDSLFAFDEEERILIVSILTKSRSRVLWTSAAGIDRDAMRFQRLGAILDYVAHVASISCANVFLAAVSWNLRTRTVKLPLEVERSNALY